MKLALQKVAALLALLTLSFGWTVEARADAEPVVALPKDPQEVVLSWDLSRTDIPRKKPGPTLLVRASGLVAVADPHGEGAPAEAKLSADELQDLVRFVVREQNVFAVDAGKLDQQLRRENKGRGPFSNLLAVHADGKRHEVRCADLDGAGDVCADAKRMSTILNRLARLRAWAYAGGNAGLATVVQSANQELGRKFPEAPPLAAADLVSAVQKLDGSTFAILERHAVAADGNPYSFVHARVDRPQGGAASVVVRADLAKIDTAKVKAKPKGPWNLVPTPIAKDASVKWDYPILYVRVPRKADPLPFFPTARGSHVAMTPNSDLMILYPDGRDEVLVAAGADEAIIDPAVSFDAAWVYFVKIHGFTKRDDRVIGTGSHIFKVNVATRQIVQLTHGGFTPNLGDGELKKNPFLAKRDVINIGPCPLPGGRLIFTSDRNAFTAATDSGGRLAQQLFVMDDDGANVECIGHLNLGTVLHPVVLKDGRVMFSTNEVQGLRIGYSAWGLWTINPDGTHWEPLVSAFAGQLFHFQTQLSDGHVVVGSYYDGIDRGYGAYHKFPVQAPDGQYAFGPANRSDKRNQRGFYTFGFQPFGFDTFTLFASDQDVRPNSGLGQFRDPAPAPENHLLTSWAGSHIAAENPTATAPSIDGNQFRPKTNFISGICMIKSGRPVNEPGQMVVVKLDPEYHAIMPRALTTYKRIYGIDEPVRIAPIKNDGTIKNLPEGTPFGLVGTSSLYKRESYPEGKLTPGVVDARSSASADDPFKGLGGFYRGFGSPNWTRQGSDAGYYENSDIHAIRILLLEPVTRNNQSDVHPVQRDKGQRAFHGHGTRSTNIGMNGMPTERYRILGEFPVRQFSKDGKQPLDPDGNPDTSFLTKIPADVAWTFQTLDKRGMVLNMAQTWHQVRPGERRVDCGGCHAHSQKPTEFEQTRAAKPDYEVWDLTKKFPLITSKAHDQTGKQWDEKNESGVRFVDHVTNVEYFRDIKPILDRSCVACHSKSSPKPAANLILDDDALVKDVGIPGTYARLALDDGMYGRTKYVPAPLGEWGFAQASRYVRKLQARRSLLVWKIYGERLDGFKNDDFVLETKLGDKKSLTFRGQPVEDTPKNIARVNIHYIGSMMPPPEAVAGTYEGPDGKKVKVPALTDEEKLAFARWVDLGCPIDLAYDPAKPAERGNGWMLDDQRPTLTMAQPRAGGTEPVTRIVIGMQDYDTGLDVTSFRVTADFAVDGAKPGENLAPRFKTKSQGVWELTLANPIAELSHGNLTVSIRDRQGNISVIERSLSVGAARR